MKYKTLINEIKIPVLGLWTWLIGGAMESDYSDDKNAINSIKKAIELGYTHIDTAEMYWDGHSEELIWEAIKELNRDELFITTKVRNTKLRYNDVIKSAKESMILAGATKVNIKANNEWFFLKIKINERGCAI